MVIVFTLAQTHDHVLKQCFDELHYITLFSRPMVIAALDAAASQDFQSGALVELFSYHTYTACSAKKQAILAFIPFGL